VSAWGSSWGSSWAAAWGAISSAGRRVVLRFDSPAAKVVELQSRIWM
jgi:hypothetical protein